MIYSLKLRNKRKNINKIEDWINLYFKKIRKLNIFILNWRNQNCGFNKIGRLKFFLFVKIKNKYQIYRNSHILFNQLRYTLLIQKLYLNRLNIKPMRIIKKIYFPSSFLPSNFLRSNKILNKMYSLIR